MDTGVIIGSVTSLLLAAVTMVGGAAWLNRRHTAKFLEGQAENELAKAHHERAQAAAVIEGAAAKVILMLEKELEEERSGRSQEREAYMAYLGVMTNALATDVRNSKVVLVEKETVAAG
jgi:hypothetical protein